MSAAAHEAVVFLADEASTNTLVRHVEDLRLYAVWLPVLVKLMWLALRDQMDPRACRMLNSKALLVAYDPSKPWFHIGITGDSSTGGEALAERPE